MPNERVVHIGIHPYTAIGELYEGQPNFVRIRDRRIKDPNLDQILLVEEIDLEATKAKFGLSGKHWSERLFVMRDGKPANISLPEFSRHIVREFPASRYVIWGAELYLKGGVAVGGCVAYVYYNLNLPNKMIEIDACFVADKFAFSQLF